MRFLLIFGLLLAVLRPALAQAPEMVLQLGHVGAVTAVAWMPGGRHLVTASADGTIKVWDAPTGAVGRTIDARQEALAAVAVSADARYIASGGGDGTLKIWHAATGALARELPCEGEVRSVGFSPDGRSVAAAMTEPGRGQIRVWEPFSGALLHKLDPRDELRCLDFSPRGNFIAAGLRNSPGETRAVELWDAATGALTTVLRVEAAPAGVGVEAVAVSPDGTLVAAGTSGGLVEVWDASTTMQRHTLQAGGAVRALAFSPDGRLIVAGTVDGHLLTWAVGTGGRLQAGTVGGGAVDALAPSPLGEWIACGQADGRVELWDVQSASLKGTLPRNQALALQPAFSAQGAVRVVGSDVSGMDPRDALFDGTAARLVLLQALRGFEPERIAVAALARDLPLAAGGGARGAVSLWSGLGDLLFHLEEHRGAVTAVALSPDGAMVASGSDDHAVHLRRIADLALPGMAERDAARRRLAGHTAFITALAFAPDGRMLASAGWDRRVALWDVASGTVLLSVLAPDAVNTVDLAGGRVAAGMGAPERPGVVAVWTLQSGDLPRFLEGHRAPVTSVAFAGSGDLLVSGSRDGEARLWDPRDGSLRRTLTFHPGGVDRVAVSPDGRRIITVGHDRILRLWDAGTGAFLAGLLLAPVDLALHWIAFDGHGNFTGSPGAQDLIRWRTPTGLHPGAYLRSTYFAPRRLEPLLQGVVPHR